MTNNYEVYTCPWCENPEQECREWFWASISLDDTLSKQFLEDLQDIADLIDKGQLKLIAFRQEDFGHDS